MWGFFQIAGRRRNCVTQHRSTATCAARDCDAKNADREAGWGHLEFGLAGAATELLGPKSLPRGLPMRTENPGTGILCFVTGGPGRRLLAGPPLWFRSGSFWQRFAQLPLVAGLVAMRSPATVAYVE